MELLTDVPRTVEEIEAWMQRGEKTWKPRPVTWLVTTFNRDISCYVDTYTLTLVTVLHIFPQNSYRYEVQILLYLFADRCCRRKKIMSNSKPDLELQKNRCMDIIDDPFPYTTITFRITARLHLIVQLLYKLNYSHACKRHCTINTQCDNSPCNDLYCGQNQIGVRRLHLFFPLDLVALGLFLHPLWHPAPRPWAKEIWAPRLFTSFIANGELWVQGQDESQQSQLERERVLWQDDLLFLATNHHYLNCNVQTKHIRTMNRVIGK